MVSLLLRLKWFKIFLFNIALTTALLEGGLRLGMMEVIESIRTGEIEPTRQIELEYLSANSPYIRQRIWNIPQPFFGFGQPNEDSNLNFEISENYSRRPPNQNIVAIFGGSVANNLYVHGDLGDSSSVSAGLGLEVQKVMNFSIPGGRQPQALNISSIYGHAYNISINIEGRNEMHDMGSVQFPPYFPNAAGASSLYFGQVENLALVETANQIPSLVGRARLSHEELYSEEQRLISWIRFSCLQQNIHFSMGVKSFFVIQPVPQHFKELSDEEKAYISDDQWLRRKANYSPVTKIDIDQLKRAGLQIIDLSRIFEGNKETIYTDSCCHLNERGNLLIIEKTMKNIKNLLSQERSPKVLSFIGS